MQYFTRKFFNTFKFYKAYHWIRGSVNNNPNPELTNILCSKKIKNSGFNSPSFNSNNHNNNIKKENKKQKEVEFDFESNNIFLSLNDSILRKN